MDSPFLFMSIGGYMLRSVKSIYRHVYHHRAKYTALTVSVVMLTLFGRTLMDLDKHTNEFMIEHGLMDDWAKYMTKVIDNLN